MTTFTYKFLVLLLITSALSVMPFQKGYCECQIAGEWCGGDPPAVCCKSNEYECAVFDSDSWRPAKGDEIGTCEKRSSVNDEKAADEEKAPEEAPDEALEEGPEAPEPN